jgi:hypothetical protein
MTFLQLAETPSSARLLYMEVLKERQVHSITVGAHALVTQTQNSKQAHHPHAARQEHALAKLQAQRLLNRAEQRLTAATRPADARAAEFNHEAVGSQHAFAKPATAAPQSKRLRAKVTTTAGSGMQRQAPSRCSSATCSVRGSLESLHQQQQSRNRTSAPAAHSLFSSMPRAAGTSQVANGMLQIQGTGVSHPQQQQRQQSRLPAAGRPAGLSHHGSGSRFALRPHCQQAVLRAPATASRPYGYSSASAGALGPTFMGSGVAWVDLHAAAARSAAVQPQGGSNLEHRRQVQQCRWAIWSSSSCSQSSLYCPCSLQLQTPPAILTIHQSVNEKLVDFAAVGNFWLGWWSSNGGGSAAAGGSREQRRACAAGGC